MEFEELYTTYFSDVYRYIRRLSGSEQIAEEITAETFFKAISAIERFRGESDIRVWLCQIAKNCYFSYLKKRGRFIPAEEAALTELPDPKESLENRFIRKEEAAHLRKILHDIPEPYKEVFMWRVFAELSFQQIGQIFRKSENWACVTYHRARRKIKEKWEANENEKHL